MNILINMLEPQLSSSDSQNRFSGSSEGSSGRDDARHVVLRLISRFLSNFESNPCIYEVDATVSRHARQNENEN